jgi:hypothetical protein
MRPRTVECRYVPLSCSYVPVRIDSCGLVVLLR